MITDQAIRHGKQSAPDWAKWIWAGLELVLGYALVYHSHWLGYVLLLVAAIELRAGLAAGLKTLGSSALERSPELIISLSAILILAVLPRLASQMFVLVLYATWLAWRARAAEAASASYVHMLLVQAVMFEAIFLTAAIWQIPAWLTVGLVWAGSYLSVYSLLRRRGDRTAGVMAATWAVIAAEVSWVLLLWLVTYVLQKNGFVMVPQPTLILTALAYVFGSIFLASKQGTLSRSRLGEYLVIGLILILIVVVETLWRHAA
ncbi:MAG: hypothetical protein NVSMB39_5070 [Candidatus Saccharimonadales bacterium]